MSRASPVAVIALVAAALAALMVAGAGPAYRFELLSLRSAFSLMRRGAFTGIAAFLLALLGAWLSRRRGASRWRTLAIVGAIAGALAFAVPFAMLQGAKQAPPIHDITTDMIDPPQFVAVLPLRKNAPNPAAYGGEPVARQQRAAFPDIGPATLTVPPERAYARALEVATRSGWDIHAAVPAEGRIEATDTTRWFGFRDDIVVRVTPIATGSRIDVRSVSRLGQGDLGKNAQRVRAFLREVTS